MKKFGVLFAALSFYVVSPTATAQTNKILNFSFEQVGTTEGSAAGWNPQGSGYTRVALPSGDGWDGGYALRLDGTSGNLAGAVQRVPFNQGAAVPILLTARVKGQGIGNFSSDKYGAVLYCRVLRADGSMDYCPTTQKTKNIGTFWWTHVGINTATLLNGHKPVEWVEVQPMLGMAGGSAWFDDIHVAEYPQGSFQGAVTIVPDDGYIEHYSVAFPAMESFGFKGSLALVVNYLSAGDPAYMNLAQARTMRDAGWEVMAHGLNHSNLATLLPAEMEDQLYWSKVFWRAEGFDVRSFVLPFGDYNGLVLGVNDRNGYFDSIRKVERGYNPMGTFPYDVKAQELKSATTLADVIGWLNEARARKAWLVIFLHKIRDPCPDQYCNSPELFLQMLGAISASTLPVVTYEEGLTLVKSPR